MKILIDMNLSPMLATLLTDFGIESIHWSSIGEANAQDEELFRYAYKNDYVILTADLDFSVLLSHTKSCKPSVAQLRLRAISLVRDTPLIHAALLQNEDELSKGAILTIDLKKNRVRILPLAD
jgi:predicted nuclease of predicted toxin-antitoxin system